MRIVPYSINLIDIFLLRFFTRFHPKIYFHLRSFECRPIDCCNIKFIWRNMSWRFHAHFSFQLQYDFCQFIRTLNERARYSKFGATKKDKKSNHANSCVLLTLSDIVISSSEFDIQFLPEIDYAHLNAA